MFIYELSNHCPKTQKQYRNFLSSDTFHNANVDV